MVREFVTEFRGLSGSAKVSAVLQASGLARTTLADLFDGGKPSPVIRRLLREMQARSNPVKPADLGVIGREHFLARFKALGGHSETFEYRCVRRLDDDVPTVVEAAFAYAPARGRRTLFTGVNWSPAISNPFRQLGSGGESLERVLAGQYAEAADPVLIAVHLASPVISYLDWGKSGIALRGGETPEQDGPDESESHYSPEVDAPDDGSLAAAHIAAVKGVTKRWKKQKRAEIKDASAWSRRQQAMVRARRVSAKDAAAEIMQEAYLKASAQDTLPAQRQIMYAARDHIQTRTGKQHWEGHGAAVGTPPRSRRDPQRANGAPSAGCFS
jgi:hypothetical protein